MPPLPLSASENQVYIVPIGPMFIPYAEKVATALYSEGIRFAVDVSTDTLLQKIAHGEQSNYNYIVFVARDEASSGAVSIRSWDRTPYGTKPICEFIAQLKAEIVA
jgi:threonyl-tRNA synthetase